MHGVIFLSGSTGGKALNVRDNPPKGEVMDIAELAAGIELPMERPLYTPTLKPVFADIALQAGEEDVDAGALYSQRVVDSAQLASHIRHVLQDRSQVTLRELIKLQPLQQGLAELVAYLQLGSESFKTVVDEGTPESIDWDAMASDGAFVSKQAVLPRIIFVR